MIKHTVDNLKLNDIGISASWLEETEVEINGKKLKELFFSFQVEKADFQYFRDLLSQSEIDVFIIKTEKQFKTHATLMKYPDNIEITDTVPFTVRLTEIDTIEWNSQLGISTVALQASLHLDAIKELLIEKGIVTKDELKEKISEVIERDQKKKISFLLNGK